MNSICEPLMNLGQIGPRGLCFNHFCINKLNGSSVPYIFICSISFPIANLCVFLSIFIDYESVKTNTSIYLFTPGKIESKTCDGVTQIIILSVCLSKSTLKDAKIFYIYIIVPLYKFHIKSDKKSPISQILIIF